MTQTRTHDEQYRLTNLTLAGGSTLDQLAYTYDPAGNVDYLDDQLNSAYDRDYSYDVLNRLKWDSGVSAGNPTYTYDGNGNRLTRTAGTGFPAQTISYVAGKNRMSTYNSTAVSYDGMGNVTNSGNNLTATTEVNGRLLTATVPNSRRVTLLYNGLGEMARARTETRSGNQWTTPYWEYASFAPDGRALGLIQENTSRTEWEWVWVDNLPVVQFQDSYNSSGTYTGTTVTYLHPDQLGTPRIGTNTAGAISWRYRSDAFGIATISGTHTVRLRLPGQIDLGTGGINYNYFRDYDPNLGRYLEADPIGLDGGLNTYGYVGANPLRHVDPTGEFYSSGHLIVSANALQGSGLSNQVAQEAVAASMGLDFVPGSQTPSSANLHSMTKANQTEADAARQAADFIDAQLARCDATGLGYALHTVQDSVPGGHRFKTYRGILDTILNDPLHFVQDLWPYGDTYTEALTKSQIVVRRFQRDCSCQSE